jgi:hypothetical protein
MHASELLLHGLPSLLALGVNPSVLVQEMFEILSAVANGATELDKPRATASHAPGLERFHANG